MARMIGRGQIAEAAEVAFWNAVAEAVPTATSGDLEPALAVQFSALCRQVVSAWIDANAPTVKISVFRNDNDEVTVTDDGNDYDDSYFYDDGEKSSSNVERDIESEINDRVAHYRQAGNVQIVRA